MPNKPTMKGDIVRDILPGFTSPLDFARVEDLTQEELYARVITCTDLTELEILLMEVRVRGLVPLEWYDHDVVRFIKFDTLPNKTGSGLWVQSLLRDTRNFLTYDEITAYLKGDITLPPLVHVAHVPIQLRDMLEGSLGTSVRHWSAVELVNFCAFDTRPVKTMRGIYRHSPIRAMKSASQWLDAELLDWVEGFIGLNELTTERQLMAELQSRYNIPADWSRDEVVTWVTENIVPEYTMDGIWVNSQVRMEKTVSEWSTLEVVAFARGNITIEENRRKDLMREIRSRYFYPSTVSDDGILSDIRAKGIHIDQNSSTALVEATETFIQGISTAPSDREASYVHTKYLQELRRVMTVQPDIFYKVWTAVLNRAKDNEAIVFNDVSVFRGFDMMTATKINRDSYSQLLLLMINTMHPETRYTLSNVSSFIAPIRFPGAKDNLSLYYGV